MTGEGMQVRLRYLVEDGDRHGNVRLYVRIPGRNKVRIREQIGTEAFMDAYRAAIAGTGTYNRRRAATQGSFRFVVERYYSSTIFQHLDPGTRAWQRRYLDLICAKNGHLGIRTIQRKHVQRFVDAKADTPHAANMLLKALRALFKFATRHEYVDQNPARDVESVKFNSQGHHRWTPDEILQFEARYPIGSKERLAMALLLYTGCRREDVVRLGPQHLKNGRLKYTQAKNEHRKRVVIDIPAHRELQGVIDAAGCTGHLTFLVTQYGGPFQPDSFGNWFRQSCRDAGLEHCSAHGLRKAMAARLAEKGATTKEIMSVTGHVTLGEVERYTREADQRTLADAAIGKLG
jgi:integrase/recombinase XerD